MTISSQSTRKLTETTIVPVDPARAGSASDHDTASRRTFGFKRPSRRTFGWRKPSRRTFGYKHPSRRTFGFRHPSRRTFGFRRP
jgi:hypothetical protein